MAQIHKRFNDEQVKDIFDRYLNKEIKRSYIQEILGIKERRFFALLERYRSNPDSFSVQYNRTRKFICN